MESVDTWHCSPDTCPVANGFLGSAPSFAGCIVVLVAFGLLVPVSVVQAVRYRTPLFTVLMIAGLFLEVVSYAGRLLLGFDLAARTYFILCLLGAMMAPSFITAAIYIVVPHIMTIYGRQLTVLVRPSHVAYLFLGFDVFALALQAAGSAYAAGGMTKAEVCSVSPLCYNCVT